MYSIFNLYLYCVDWVYSCYDNNHENISKKDYTVINDKNIVITTQPSEVTSDIYDTYSESSDIEITNSESNTDSESNTSDEWVRVI